MDTLIFTTAIVVIPPEDVWPTIQAIRTKHDGKVRRWMPPIALVYPCMPVSDFQAAQERLTLDCRDVPAFEIELAEFRTFHHRRGHNIIWLARSIRPLMGRQCWRRRRTADLACARYTWRLKRTPLEPTP